MEPRLAPKRILNILVTGNPGGIERLCLDVARFSEEDNHFYFLWGGGVIADSICNYTKNVVIRHFSYRRIIQEYISLRNYIDRNAIEIILVQAPSPAVLMYLDLLRLSRRNIRICTYIHSDPIDIFTSDIKRLQFKLFTKHIDGCIAVSEYVAMETRRMFKIDNIKVIYNGTDIEKFGKSENSLQNDCVRLIYVGRLIKEKGIDLLIRVLANIDTKYTLTIVGDGPCRIELEKLSKLLGLADKIAFLGTRNDVNDLLQDADLFVHPAVWKEGFGITLIESMAAGVPCLAFARGAVPEIISDDINGFLVNEFTEEAFEKRLSEVMRLLAETPDRFSEIVAAARDRAKDFNIYMYVQTLSHFLHSLL